MKARFNVRSFLLTAVTLALLAAAAGCGSPAGSATTPGGDLQGTITISGAWALYPLMVRWGEEFQKLHPGVRLDISAGGAGKGMADALAGAVDVGMVSREVYPEEVAKGAFWIAVTRDAVFVTVSEKNPVWEDLHRQGLTQETLVGIYVTGQVKTWGQAVGRPKVDDPIHVFTRSDACGAAETWARYLGKKQEDLLGVAVYGDPGLLEAVIKDPLGIGFNNLNYAFDTQTGQPVAGARVAPLDANGDGQTSPEELYDTKAQAVSAVALGHYPSPPARDLNLVTRGKPTGLTQALITWILTDGQGYVDEAGYIALPQERLDAELKKLDRRLRKVVWRMQEVVAPTVRRGQRGVRRPFSLGLSRRTQDRLARRTMGLLTLGAVLLLPLIALALTQRAWPILAVKPPGELLFSTTWRPMQGAFGFLPFILGTLWVTAVGMILSVPPSLLTAIYLAEYAPARIRAVTRPLIELLAGIPSVVYGVWGVLTIVPWVQHTVASALNRWLGVLPLFRSDNPTGYGVLAGGIVLAVMVFPIIIAVAEDVIRAVPQGLREASLALGATRWQMVRSAVLRRAWPGVLAAVVLGFSRAFGETMAVLMVVGNVPQVPHSIFDAAYPLTALIANNYGEMMSIPLYDAALLGGALILLLMVLAFNTASRLVLVRLVRGE